MANCDIYESLFNFAGDYVNWIEKTANVSLPRSQDNHLLERPYLVPLSTHPTADEYLLSRNHENPEWYTVHQLAEIAARRLSFFDAFKLRGFIENNKAIQDYFVKKTEFSHQGQSVFCSVWK